MGGGSGNGTLVSDPAQWVGPEQVQWHQPDRSLTPRVTTEIIHFRLGTPWQLLGQETWAAGPQS